MQHIVVSYMTLPNLISPGPDVGPFSFAPTHEAGVNPHTILVADEDIDTRIILRALLERHGYRVLEAANARRACEVAQEPVSVVVLNHPMNVSETLTLAAWLRAQPQTRNVPIINLTSRPVPYFVEDAYQQGVTVTLPKPIDVQRMLQLVEELAAAAVAH
jgi:CheY-like chemotaxis protein